MKRVTEFMLLVIVFALAGYDIYAFAVDGPECTITRVTYAAMQRWPILGVAIGIVIGHIAWPHRGINNNVG